MCRRLGDGSEAGGASDSGLLFQWLSPRFGLHSPFKIICEVMVEQLFVIKLGVLEMSRHFCSKPAQVLIAPAFQKSLMGTFRTLIACSTAGSSVAHARGA